MQFEMKILIERNVCIFQLSYKSYKLSENYTVKIKRRPQINTNIWCCLMVVTTIGHLSIKVFFSAQKKNYAVNRKTMPERKAVLDAVRCNDR